MAPKEFAELLIPAIGSVGLLILKHAVDELKQMKASMIELNRQIAVVIVQVDSHERRLTKLEE